jgi:hypothetical protein
MRGDFLTGQGRTGPGRGPGVLGHESLYGITAEGLAAAGGEERLVGLAAVLGEPDTRTPDTAS